MDHARFYPGTTTPPRPSDVCIGKAYSLSVFVPPQGIGGRGSGWGGNNLRPSPNLRIVTMVFIKCSRVRQQGIGLDFKPSPYLLCPAPATPQAPCSYPSSPLTWDVIPHQKLEYAARESNMGATHCLILSAMSRVSGQAEDQVVTASTNCKTPERGISMGHQSHLADISVGQQTHLG